MQRLPHPENPEESLRLVVYNGSIASFHFETLMEEDTMPNTQARHQRLPQEVIEALNTYRARVAPMPVARRVWQRMLKSRDHDRLGGSFETAYTRHGTVGIWTQLHDVSQTQAVLEIALRCQLMDAETHRWLMQETGLDEDVSLRQLRDVIESGALVLCEPPRSAFWDGERINIDWDRQEKLWRFFLHAGIAAKRGRVLDFEAIDESATVSSIGSLKCRLVNHDGFPPTLGDRFEAKGNGRYLLDLPPGTVRLFQAVDGQSLVETNSWSTAAMPR